MSVIVKGSLAALGAAVVVTGGYYLATRAKGKELVTLYQEKNLDPEYSESFQGFKGGAFASPFNEKNVWFWEASYKQWQEDQKKPKANKQFSDEFKDETKITKAFEANKQSETKTALNQVCHEAYKRKFSIDDARDKRQEPQGLLLDDVVDYCSQLHQQFDKLRDYLKKVRETYIKVPQTSTDGSSIHNPLNGQITGTARRSSDTN